MDSVNYRANMIWRITSFVVIVFIAVLSAHRLALVLRARAASATCYWVGDTSPANWNDATHWSSSSSGSGSTCDGGVVPDSDDTVVFSGNNNNINLDTSPTVAALVNSATYSGTFNMNGNSLTVTGDFTFTSGNFTAGAGALNVSGNFNIAGSTYTYNTQTVTLSGASKTLDQGTNSLYNLVIDGTISVANSDANIYHSLTVNANKTLAIPSGRKMILANTASSTFSGTVDGDGLLELVKYACKNLGTGGTLNINVRCKPKDNPNDNGMPARTFGKDLEFYNDTGATQRVSITNGNLSVLGNLYVNQYNTNSRIDLSTNDVGGALNSFQIYGDFKFLGSQIGGDFEVGSTTAVHTFSGDIDMNLSQWRNGGLSCESPTNVVFNGNNKSYHHGVYAESFGCLQPFYNLRISSTHFDLYDVDSYDYPSLGESYSRQGLRIQHTLTIDDGTTLVINNPIGNPACHLSGFQNEWYAEKCQNGWVALEGPGAWGATPLPAGWDGSHLDIQGSGKITGDGFLQLSGWGWGSQYGNIDDFSETDGTIDVNVLFSNSFAMDGTNDLKIVGRTFNKDVAFASPSAQTALYKFGNADNQTLTIGGDLIFDGYGPDSYQYIDCSVFNPNVNIGGNFYSDIYGSGSYLKMGSGEWKVGGNFESVSRYNRIYGEDASLTMYGDEKILSISYFSAGTPYYYQAQGIGILNIDNSINPNNTIYLDSILTVTNTLNIDSTSNLNLRNYKLLEMWTGATTNVNGYINGDLEYLELYDTAVNNFNFSAGHVNLPVRMLAQTQDITIPAKTYDMATEISNRSGSAKTATLGTATGQTFNFVELYLDTEAPVGSNIVLDGATYNPTVNITGNLGVRGPIAMTKTFNLGSGNWNIGGSANFSNAIVNSGTSKLNMANSSASDWQDITTTRSTFYATASYNGNLYVAGDFTSIDGISTSYIAKWNGAEWSAVGTGCNSKIYALYVHENLLYAGGNFTTCGGTTVHYIASWNGTAWSALGNGLSDAPRTLASYNGNLVVGGWFASTYGGGTTLNYVGQWNGTSWGALGSGIADDWQYETVKALKEYSGRLYAGGGFYTDDSTDNDYFAYFDGTNWIYPGGIDNYVYAIDDFGGSLVVGGYFQNINGSTCQGTASFNGTSFSCMGGGIESTHPIVNNFITFNSELYAGGQFGGESGYQTPNYNILKWDGADWVSTGKKSINPVYDLEIHNNDLIAVGKVASAPPYFAGTIFRLSPSNSYLIANQGGYPPTKNQLYNLQVSSSSSQTTIFSDDITIASTFTDNTAASNIKFQSGRYFHFPHLEVTGGTNQLIMWRSTTDTQTHYLIQDDVCPNVRYVDYMDSNASLGGTIYPLSSHDSGNNTNWDAVNVCLTEGGTGEDNGGDEPIIVTVTIFGGDIEIEAGETVDLDAFAYDGNGDEIPETTFDWSVVNGGGTIEEGGIFTADDEPGVYEDTIVAEAGEVVDAITVTIDEVTPNSVVYAITAALSNTKAKIGLVVTNLPETGISVTIALTLTAIASILPVTANRLIKEIAKRRKKYTSVKLRHSKNRPKLVKK